MPDPLRDRIESIFVMASAAAEDQREAVLDRECAGDDTLRREIKLLLNAGSSGTKTIANLCSDGADRLIGTSIGPYKLRELTGEGGFGTVYIAEQEKPVRRRVALKVIKLGMDTQQVIARFEAERQALAMMDHPNIARVLDAGATAQGRPWFAMELVRGVPITNYCDSAHLTIAERLELFIAVCHAVQHAHQKGVIHRDLKPNNVLVSIHDGKPVPKVIDFGIAKAVGAQLTDKTVYTLHRQMMGTPAYMSPEQAEMSSLDVDTRADVYSLGVLLYELLTGSPPFNADQLNKAGWAEMQRIVREVEPERPSTRVNTLGNALPSIAERRRIEPKRLGPLLRGDLDWIALKCLEKDRARRYGAASELAADIQRHLSGEPVLAAPPSAAYRMRKFARKRRGQVTAVSLIAASLLISLITTWIANAKVRQKSDELEWTASIAHSSLARFEMDNGAWHEARKRLESTPQDKRGWEWRHLFQRARSVMFELPPAYKAIFSHDASRIVTVSTDHTARLWNALNGDQLGVPMPHEDSIAFISFSPDDTRILTASEDGTARIWDAKSGEPLGEAMEHGRRLNSASFNPDGTVIITASRSRTARLWDGYIGEPLDLRVEHQDLINSVVFSPDGTRILTASWDGTARLWDAQTGQPRGRRMQHDHSVESAVFSPDGTSILTVSQNAFSPRLWNGKTGEPLPVVMWHDSVINSAVFSPDGSRILTTSMNETARLSNTKTGEPIYLALDHQGTVTSASFSTDGTRILTASSEAAHIWDASTGRRLGEARPHGGAVRFASFSPDGKSVLLSLFKGDEYSPPKSIQVISLDRFDAPAWTLDGDDVDLQIAIMMMNDEQGSALKDFALEAAAQNPQAGITAALDLARLDAMFAPMMADCDGQRYAVIGKRSVRFHGRLDGRVEAGERGQGHTAPASRTSTIIGREIAALAVDGEPISLAFTPDCARLIVRLADKSAMVWDTRSPEARQKDRDRRWEDRELSAGYVDQLLNGRLEFEELEHAIRCNKSLSPARQLAALSMLREQRSVINACAQDVFRNLVMKHITSARVQAAALAYSADDIRPYGARILKILINEAQHWEPGPSILNGLAWNIVKSPEAPREGVEIALEAAREAFPLDSTKYFNNTLAVALYRYGLFAEAEQVLLKSMELHALYNVSAVTPKAFLAMTLFKLGRVEDAKGALQELRTLYIPDGESRQFLREAEALIEGGNPD